MTNDVKPLDLPAAFDVERLYGAPQDVEWAIAQANAANAPASNPSLVGFDPNVFGERQKTDV